MQESFKNNKGEPALDYVQLATIKPYGKPTNRTVHFQSFFNVHPSEKENKFISMLMFFVDVRTDDIIDILDGSPYGEVCMFLPITHEVFRLSGKLYIISSPNCPIYSRVNHKNLVFSKFGYNMERERLNQWKEYILPIHKDIPNKFKENNEMTKKSSIQKENMNNSCTKLKQYFIEDENDTENVDKNYLTSNPRNIMLDDYLNYHNLNQDKLIKRKENDLNVGDDFLVADTSGGDSNDSDSKIKGYQDGMDISKQMDFKPHRHYSQKHYHRRLSDPGPKSSEDENSVDYYHPNCELCQKMLNDRKKEQRRSFSLSMEDLKEEMIDNFCLLLLDADKVYYSNYKNDIIKVHEYTRSYSIHEDTMKDNYVEKQHKDYNANDFQAALTNTYINFDFNNLNNIQLLHSNKNSDSVPLNSSPVAVNNNKNNTSTAKSEIWNCITVNYSHIP